MWKLLLIVPLFIAIGNTQDCVPRAFGSDKIVCVCNATYCDSTPELDPNVLKNDSFYWYMSSKAGDRLKIRTGQFDSCSNLYSIGATTLTIDTTKRYQTIFGFGGAFTDSAGINIKKLSPAAQDQLIRTYYDPLKGSRYLLGRVPIGGTDFSTKGYSYDDNATNDTLLRHFQLASEDYDYKIPFMKRALELNPEIRFFGAVWSPPKWMKTKDAFNGGVLKEEYYQTYADYLVKFLDGYSYYGLKIWALSTGNEPLNGFVPFDPLNSMGWTPKTVRNWIANNLGPTLISSRHDTKILVLDDQRFQLPWFVEGIFDNEAAKNYTAGVAVHWYWDAFTSPTVLDETNQKWPDKFILMTEACEGTLPLTPKVDLGSWDRGQNYMLSILQYMNHWSVGWVDWNLALDSSGGPNYINNNVDSPIIVNPENDEFYKQPMYYALKHFSRFVDRGSVRVSITETNMIKSTAFVTPSRQVVVVLYNKNFLPQNVILKDLKRSSICIELPPFSMHTVIYGL